jgi:uncharacterized OB-fold protein
MDHTGHVRRNYDTQPFWEGCDAHELRIARCADCQTWIHFPVRVCPACWSDNVTFEAVDGAGHVVTFSRPRVPEGADPVVTAVVALDNAEGVRILGMLAGAAPEDVHIGMPVALDWREQDGQAVPQFVPAGGAVA